MIEEIPRWLPCETCISEGDYFNYWSRQLFGKEGKNFCQDHAPDGAVRLVSTF